MKTPYLTRIVLFSLLLLLYPIANYGDARPINGKHIISMNSSYLAHPDDITLESTNIMTNYFYQTENVELIDSVVTQNDYNVWYNGDEIVDTTSSTSVDYTGSMIWEGGLKHIHYSLLPGGMVDIIKDNQNRIIDYSGNGVSRKSYYNEYDKLDSLQSQSVMYRMLYNTQGLLTAITYGAYEIPITYPEGLPINPIDINLDEILQYYNNTMLFKLRMIYDKHFQINSYIIPDQGITSMVYPLYSNSPFTITFHDFFDYTLKFDDEGYITYYKFDRGGPDPATTLMTFTWETIVPNDDPIAPTPDLSMNVYPNPFRSNVNIELKDKSTALPDIAIYNIKGQLVRKWDVNKSTSVTWDGKDRFNDLVSSGIYLVNAKKNGMNHTRKIVKF